MATDVIILAHQIDIHYGMADNRIGVACLDLPEGRV
jgi:hypothetical protein